MFLFELTLALGFAHPDHLLRELTSRQVSDWLAYYHLRPFGFVRQSHLFGTLAAQQHNMNKTSGRSLSWNDIFPEILKRKGERDPDSKIIDLVKQYNVQRGYAPHGR